MLFCQSLIQLLRSLPFCIEPTFIEAVYLVDVVYRNYEIQNKFWMTQLSL